MEFPVYSNADNDWYMRISVSPHHVKPKVEMFLKLCKKEHAIQELISPMKDNQLPYEMCYYIGLNENYTL